MPSRYAWRQANCKLGMFGELLGPFTRRRASPPPTEGTISSLRLKHPPSPLDRRAPPSPSTTPLQVTSQDVLAAIKSFSPGSAGGRDGLRPQHLKDMVVQPGGTGVCQAFRDFCNLVFGRGRGVPEVIRPVFFGATLFPFPKKDGGIKPLAVGLALRRLVSKTPPAFLPPPPPPSFFHPKLV